MVFSSMVEHLRMTSQGSAVAISTRDFFELGDGHVRIENLRPMTRSEQWQLGAGSASEGPTHRASREAVPDSADADNLPPVFVLPPCKFWTSTLPTEFAQYCSNWRDGPGGLGGQSAQARTAGVEIGSVSQEWLQAGALFARDSPEGSKASSWQPPPVLAAEERAPHIDNLFGVPVATCERSSSTPARQGTGSCQQVSAGTRQDGMSHSHCQMTSSDYFSDDEEIVPETSQSGSDDFGSMLPASSSQKKAQKNRHCKAKRDRYRRLIDRLINKAKESREAFLQELENLPPSIAQCEDSKQRLLRTVETHMSLA
mmetsp:Transcript_138853/g.443309  ORF Transcript_138853/g.443309 Transcript_138853/m.443309 type:complete len:313 (-) Transcript_138853:147-1085(-)